MRRKRINSCTAAVIVARFRPFAFMHTLWYSVSLYTSLRIRSAAVDRFFFSYRFEIPRNLWPVNACAFLLSPIHSLLLLLAHLFATDSLVRAIYSRAKSSYTQMYELIIRVGRSRSELNVCLIQARSLVLAVAALVHLVPFLFLRLHRDSSVLGDYLMSSICSYPLLRRLSSTANSLYQRGLCTCPLYTREIGINYPVCVGYILIDSVDCRLRGKSERLSGDRI